jgi:hypothetical protein
MPFEMRGGQAKFHALDTTLFEVLARSAGLAVQFMRRGYNGPEIGMEKAPENKDKPPKDDLWQSKRTIAAVGRA